jgi:hypothetical protein
MKRLTLAACLLLAGMSLSAQLRFGNAPANHAPVSDLEKNVQKLEDLYEEGFQFGEQFCLSQEK